MSESNNMSQALMLTRLMTNVRLRGNINTSVCRDFIFKTCTREECAYRHWLSEDEIPDYLICRDFQNYPIFGNHEGNVRYCKGKNNIIRNNCKLLHKGWMEMNNLVAPSKCEGMGRINDQRFSHIPIVFRYLLQGGVKQENSTSQTTPAPEIMQTPTHVVPPPPPPQHNQPPPAEIVQQRPPRTFQPPPAEVLQQVPAQQPHPKPTQPPPAAQLQQPAARAFQQQSASHFQPPPPPKMFRPSPNDQFQKLPLFPFQPPSSLSYHPPPTHSFQPPPGVPFSRPPTVFHQAPPNFLRMPLPSWLVAPPPPPQEMAPPQLEEITQSSPKAVASSFPEGMTLPSLREMAPPSPGDMSLSSPEALEEMPPLSPEHIPKKRAKRFFSEQPTRLCSDYLSSSEESDAEAVDRKQQQGGSCMPKHSPFSMDRIRAEAERSICRNYIYQKCTKIECPYRHWISENDIDDFLICRNFQNNPIFGDGDSRYCTNENNVIRENCVLLHKRWSEMSNLVKPTNDEVIGHINDKHFSHIPIVYQHVLKECIRKDRSLQQKCPKEEVMNIPVRPPMDPPPSMVPQPMGLPPSMVPQPMGLPPSMVPLPMGTPPSMVPLPPQSGPEQTALAVPGQTVGNAPYNVYFLPCVMMSNFPTYPHPPK